MITTAQINSQTPRSFRLNLTPPYRPQAGLALSPANGTATTIVVALELALGKRSGRHNHSIEEVVLVPRGTAEMTVGKEQVRLSPGEMVFGPCLGATRAA